MPNKIIVPYINIAILYIINFGCNQTNKLTLIKIKTIVEKIMLIKNMAYAW